MTEDEMVGWHPQHDGHEFKQVPGIGDGQGGLECCRPWGHKESDMTEQLNWSENKKVLGTLGKRTILKAKEGLGVQDAGVNGKAVGWGPLGLLGQKWCDSTEPGSQHAGRPGDVSDTETPGLVMPRLLRERGWWLPIVWAGRRGHHPFLRRGINTDCFCGRAGESEAPLPHAGLGVRVFSSGWEAGRILPHQVLACQRWWRSHLLVSPKSVTSS